MSARTELDYDRRDQPVDLGGELDVAARQRLRSVGGELEGDVPVARDVDVGMMVGRVGRIGDGANEVGGGTEPRHLGGAADDLAVARPLGQVGQRGRGLLIGQWVGVRHRSRPCR